ncbi:hypothetical protein [Bosea sp. (in: a-proteobacteria)]|uniref:hypothetical protein n=1 Tax=Bosea sp. (in: a-proteobacteria) TaxID=1871050 RepID=UPI0026291743|nr:hypothetical protein [Bosea sp. (in: a-proteobacteria)]MCO5090975.1 hypothetical protein [Bosea sp. (in: a-proteobacteria)]
MVAFEKPERQDQAEVSPPTLPAVRHAAFARHWLAADEGGAELMTAAFGTAARQVRPPPAANRRPPQPIHAAGDTPGFALRLKATLALLLLILAIFFAEPAASLIGRL